jgi:hypothetical protein
MFIFIVESADTLPIRIGDVSMACRCRTRYRTLTCQFAAVSVLQWLWVEPESSKATKQHPWMDTGRRMVFSIRILTRACRETVGWAAAMDSSFYAIVSLGGAAASMMSDWLP